MSQQHNLFPPGRASSGKATTSASTSSAVRNRPSRIPVWLRVIELILFIVLRVYVGIIVLLLPWMPIWKNNSFLNHWPAVATFLSYGAVRGIVSGLGVLNIWIAITEVFRRRLPRS